MGKIVKNAFPLPTRDEGGRGDEDWDQVDSRVISSAGFLRPLPVLPDRENRALVWQARQTGDQKILTLALRHNMGLVLNVARRYLWSGLSLQDLAQEGIIGLWKAIRTYDITRNVAVSTYAISLIQQALHDFFLERGRFIRLPRHITELANKVFKAEQVLLARGEKPTDEMVAMQLGVSHEAVKSMRLAMRSGSDIISLSEPLQDGDRVYEDIIPGSMIDPQTYCLAHSELGELARSVAVLIQCILVSRGGSYWCRIFAWYYGLVPEEEKRNQRQIGQCLGVKHQRVHQILQKSWGAVTQAGAARVSITSETELLSVLARIETLSRILGIPDILGQIFTVHQRSIISSQEEANLLWPYIDMVRVSVQAAVQKSDYELFCAYYGITEKEPVCQIGIDRLADQYGLSTKSLTAKIANIWRILRPLDKHINAVKLRQRIAAVSNRRG